MAGRTDRDAADGRPTARWLTALAGGMARLPPLQQNLG
jgi:hypothetical protein